MIFEYLYIKNFMKIKEVEFTNIDPHDLMILQGSNGQGKSAVFEAMAMLLIGHRKGSSFKQYIRRGTKKFNVQARVVKYPGANPYEMNVTCSHKTMPPMNKVVRFQDDEYKNSDYDAFMKEHFDVDLIENIVLSMQGTQDLSSFRPSQLRDILTTVFKISFEEERTQVHELSSYVKEKDSSIKSKIDSLRESYAILERDEPILTRPPSQKKIDNLKEELERLEKSYEIVEGKLTKLEDLKEWHQALRNEHANLVRLQRNHLNTISSLTSDINNADTKINDAQKKLDETETKLGERKSKKQRTEEMKELNNTISELQGERRHLKQVLELMGESKCPTCHQDLPEDWKDQSEEYKTKLEEINTLMENLHDQASNITAEMEESVRLENARQQLSYQIKSLTESKEEAERKRQQQVKHLEEEGIEEEIENKETIIDNQAKEIDQMEDSLHTVIEERDSLSKQIKEVKQKIEEQQKALNDYNAKAEIVNNNAEKKENLVKEIEKLREESVTVSQDKEIHDIAEKLVDKYLPAFSVLTAGEEVLKGMRSVITPVIEGWDLRLVPSRDGVYFEYKEGEESEWSPISMASGFEKSICTIAFKLTLAAYYGLPLLVLDEIDAAAVDENSYKIFDSITQFKKAYNIYQIWLVTHKPDVINKLVQEYGSNVQVYQVKDGTFTHTYIGGGDS